MKSKLESFAILADDGFRKVGEVHKDESLGVVSSGIGSVYTKSPMTADTVSGIGSVGKQHTVATLLKLWDQELSADSKSGDNKWFEDGGNIGMNVRLEKFMPALKERYPDCTAFFSEIEKYEYFAKITLADLVNHTHGLGARNNEKMFDLMMQSDASPLTLSDIVKSTQKRLNEDGTSFDEYGKFCYGNVGFDLAGMIVETITNQPFDEAMKQTILDPYGLHDTYTQSDNQNLYRADSALDVATGFYQHGNKGEANFNKLTNTRAAGGMKSTIADLEKFAHLFMGGEMFENAQVKDAISQRDGRKYHLAIEENEDGTLGHQGDDMVFRANLKLHPETNKVETELQVLENLTHHVSRQAFEKLHGADRLKELDSAVVNSGFFPIFNSSGRPKPSGEKFNEIAQGLLQSNPQLDRLISDYTAVREAVMKHDTKSLKEEMGEVVESVVKEVFADEMQSENEKSFVERLGLKKADQEKSFAEKVQSRDNSTIKDSSTRG